MKIGIVSDIHGNQYALQAVLSEAKIRKIERLFVLGDMVGYYYGPLKVLDLLQEWKPLVIQGNHERILKELYEDKVSIINIKNKYGSGHQIALNTLSSGTLDYLFKLPVSANLEIEDIRIGLYHGSVLEPDRYIYPDADKKELKHCQNDNHVNIIGHSHYSFASLLPNGSLLINVGSVGQSRSKGGLADWCLFDTSNHTFQLNSTPYAVDKLLIEVEENDPDVPYLRDVLLR